MDIGTALDRIIVVQAGLSITSPITAAIKKAYKYMAPQQQLIADSPMFMNNWTLLREERSTARRQQFYTVHMQLFVKDANQERAADIATAFHKELIDAFDDDVTLNAAVSLQTIRGGDPTLAVLERGGESLIGLDLFMDILMAEAKAFTS